VREVEHRLLLMFEAAQVGEVRMTFGVGGRGQHREPVAAEDLHPDIGQRLAGVDGLHEDVLRTVEGFLRQQTEVGQYDESCVAQRWLLGPGSNWCLGFPAAGGRVRYPRPAP
jgi:hypothetical protein